VLEACIQAFTGCITADVRSRHSATERPWLDELESMEVDMAELVLAGLVARVMRPDELVHIAQKKAEPGRFFLRFFDASSFEAARVQMSQTGQLSEMAACAFIDCIAQAGEPFGALDVEAKSANAFPTRFLELVTVALDDERAAQTLFDGGLLQRQGRGRHFFGALPVRNISAQFTSATKAAARQVLQGGWDEDLLNILESAAFRAERHPEDVLVLTPLWREGSTEMLRAEDSEVAEPVPQATEEIDVLRWLERASEMRATDLSLIVGQPLALHGPFGRTLFDEHPLRAPEIERVLSLLLDARHRERFEKDRAVVTGFSVEGLGRFRLTALTERGVPSLSLHTHFVLPELQALGFPLKVFEPVQRLTRGLVVIAAPSGHGRSTLMASLLQSHSDGGHEVVSLEEPVASSGLRGPFRQLELHSDVELDVFRTLVRGLPPAVIGVDVMNDDEGAELALELASEGALVVLTLRAVSAAAALHRLGALDAKRSRRRLSESLGAVVSLRLAPSNGTFLTLAELLLPTEALRRHLRSNETPAPPALLETEGATLDEQLLSAVRRAALTRDDALRWLVDARRADEV
jgi:Tfp pilus assembly pilus retraction ATPase PilT